MTIDEAFIAMYLYLDGIYQQTHWDDIAILLGDLNLIAPRMTMDPAAWHDWENAVAAVPSYMEKLKLWSADGDNGESAPLSGPSGSE